MSQVMRYDLLRRAQASADELLRRTGSGELIGAAGVQEVNAAFSRLKQELGVKKAQT